MKSQNNMAKNPNNTNNDTYIKGEVKTDILKGYVLFKAIAHIVENM